MDRCYFITSLIRQDCNSIFFLQTKFFIIHTRSNIIQDGFNLSKFNFYNNIVYFTFATFSSIIKIEKLIKKSLMHIFIINDNDSVTCNIIHCIIIYKLHLTKRQYKIWRFISLNNLLYINLIRFFKSIFITYFMYFTYVLIRFY